MIKHEVDEKTFECVVKLMAQTGNVESTLLPNCRVYHCEYEYWKFLFGKYSLQDHSYTLYVYEDEDYNKYFRSYLLEVEDDN